MADGGTTRVRYRGIQVKEPPPQKRNISVLIVVIIIVAVILIAAIVVLIYFLIRGSSGGSSAATQGNLNGACFSNGTCIIGLICDAATKTCKKDVGVECSANSECVSGSLCSGGTCKLTYNQVCFNDDECIFPGTCPDGFCTTIGNDCSGNVDCVMPGLSPSIVTCDSTKLTCVLQVGQPCTSSADCGSNALCDLTLQNPQCRLLPGQACTNSAQCFNKAICNGQCSYSSCLADSECLNGFICTARKCTEVQCTTDDECHTRLDNSWTCRHALTPDTVDKCNNIGVCVTAPQDTLCFSSDIITTVQGQSDGQPCQTSAECLSFSCNQLTFTCNPAT